MIRWVIKRFISGGRAESTDWQANTGLLLSDYATRLRSSAEEAEAPFNDVFWDMAARLESIREQVLEDAHDLMLTRKFSQHHARKIVEMIETFVKLQARAGEAHAERLADLGNNLQNYSSVFVQIDNACIDNDFAELEHAVAALDAQLKYLPT